MNHTAAARVNQSRKSKLETERTIGVRCQLQRSLDGRTIDESSHFMSPTMWRGWSIAAHRGLNCRTVVSEKLSVIPG